ncbi:uncharacterized protein B0I36DRAFT_371176 [Microdochium trichocladiopsis]|uniref:Heme haloperoxidase family profile domain-containing protein n=1 Tax=Microdochium trichocladiopsis TaxID=1682393 RepID=A0A9P8YID7_9PEZI|nr:uncharacterized protein B0I36DRAFT_371176 [Microdochium trichocladiopsis]KAH7040583.1 hypothetical protein B0I36DRAFT_371176 [Microdochium trichocladiopsis]
MRYSKTIVAATAASLSGVQAQRPSNTSICDYYTTALLKNNTAENQATLLTLVVNTVVIGNYTQPNIGLKVPGILAPGTFNGQEVNLLPYFNGELASSNRGGDVGVSVNFLDGGGAAPLMENKPANDNTSNQYFLLTHLYQFFGSLLGCSMQGMPGFAAYAADPSMYDVHKFMALDAAELGYFNTQVGLAAASFGVTQADAEAVGMALMNLFGYRCSPPTTVIPAQGAQLQAICIAEDCPIATASATCSAYSAVVEPSTVASSAMGSATASSSSAMMTHSGTASMPMPTGGSATMSMPTTTKASGTGAPIPTAGAASNGFNAAAVIAGVAAFML